MPKTPGYALSGMLLCRSDTVDPKVKAQTGGGPNSFAWPDCAWVADGTLWPPLSEGHKPAPPKYPTIGELTAMTQLCESLGGKSGTITNPHTGESRFICLTQKGEWYACWTFYKQGDPKPQADCVKWGFAKSPWPPIEGHAIKPIPGLVPEMIHPPGTAVFPGNDKAQAWCISEGGIWQGITDPQTQTISWYCAHPKLGILYCFGGICVPASAVKLPPAERGRELLERELGILELPPPPESPGPPGPRVLTPAMPPAAQKDFRPPAAVSPPASPPASTPAGPRPEDAPKGPGY